jgi:hypothetical protein
MARPEDTRHEANEDDNVPLADLPEGTLDDEPHGDLPEEDDDNPFQESDEALPDDLDEAVLRKDPSKEGSRFDEV